MIIKSRLESIELKVLRYLFRRLELSAKEENHFVNMEKGFAGELQFDRMLEEIQSDWMIMNDLLLEFNNTKFQIDTLLIAGGTIYVFEVKNYEGDYYIQNERWYSLLSKIEMKNPLLQLQRSETLLRGLLKELGFNLPIKSHLVFINPGFQLYQTPTNIPAVFPAQLKRFLEKLKAISVTSKPRDKKLAEQLVSRCLKENPFLRIPEYAYEELRKGVPCGNCTSFLAPLTQGVLFCPECGNHEKVDSAVIKSTEEFTILFPERRITTNTIFDWCNMICSKKVIKRIVGRHYEKHGKGKASYYKRK